MGTIYHFSSYELNTTAAISNSRKAPYPTLHLSPKPINIITQASRKFNPAGHQSFIMACFGCSRRASKTNLPQDIGQDLVKTGSLTKKKKKNSLISWPRFCTKKSDSKTVPVDISMSGSLDRPISKSHSFKLDKNNIGSSKKYRLPIGVNAINSYKKRLGTVKEIILESREINDLSSLTKEDKYDKKRSGRKKEINKTRSISKSSSPPENINPSTTVTTRVDQTSLRPPKKAKLATRENGNDIVSHEKKESTSKEALDSNSMIGLSIVVVILVLLLFLGKLYAILCTSAWFYMIPRLRTAVDSNVIVNNGLDSNVPDFNSDEHKKRVVLEGLLQRNQRNVIRIL